MQKILFLIIVVFTCIWSAPGGWAAERGQPTVKTIRFKPNPKHKRVIKRGKRINLLNIALKLSEYTNPVNHLPMRYVEYFHQPSKPIFNPPAPAKTPSPFEEIFRQQWKPEHLDPDPIANTRAGLLPNKNPWGSPTRTAQAFTATDFFRGSVINTISRWADDKGWVDTATLKKKFSNNPMERAVLEEILKHGTAKMNQRWDSILAHLDQATMHKVAHQFKKAIVPQMPTLKWISRVYNPQNKLSGVRRVWAQQHILGNTYGFLKETGIPADRLELWGKVYSFDPRAGALMSKDGYTLHGNPVARDRKLIERQIDAELSKIADPKRHRKPLFILLDDGGDLIEIAARYVNKKYPDHGHLFAAVEQTMGGINRLKEMNLPFKVVNSGGAWVKKEYGSPMFGHAVALESHRLMKEYNHLQQRLTGEERPRQIVVRGYGDIGRQVALYFKERGYSVLVYDKSRAARLRAKDEGFETRSRQVDTLKRAHVLISCVGRKGSLRTPSLYHLPHGALVINGASFHEFGRSGGIDGLPKINSDEYLKSAPVTRTLVRPNPMIPGKEQLKNLTFIKNGGVVNFPQELKHPRSGKLIPGRYIQLQLGQLYMDLLTAMDGGKRGLTFTSRRRQEALVKHVEGQLTPLGESLLKPKW